MVITDPDPITKLVIGVAIEVHKTLGPGLLESAYESCLYYELIQRGLSVKRQHALPVVYKQVKRDCGYRLDLLVEDCVVVELKAVDQIMPIHEAQPISYLKLSRRTVGLLLNINCMRMVDGITRRVLNHTA